MEGFIQGLVASISGLILVRIVVLILNRDFGENLLMNALFPKINFLSPLAVALILLAGAVVGMLGSYVASKKFTNV